MNSGIRHSDITRRSALLGAAGVFLTSRYVMAQEHTPRIAAVDWAMLETLMALGVTPVAATELLRFRRDAVEPAIPASVVDLGLRGSPNFELLHMLEPELILSSPFYTRHQQALENIAPVLSLPFYTRGEPPFEKALSAVGALGERLERRAVADAVLADAAATIGALRQRLARFSARPTYLINVGDARHFRAFGADSMFGDMLSRLGLDNAWTDRSRYSFAAPVPLETLAERGEARIVIVSAIPVEARRGFLDSMIWKRLEPVRAGRVTMLDNINPYGGIVAGMRFARLLAAGLDAGGEQP